MVERKAGFIVEQPAQETDDFAFPCARIEQSLMYSRSEWHEPGSCSFRHVWWIWVIPTFFYTSKSHVCILRVNDP